MSNSYNSGKFNIINNPPYASDIYSYLSNEKTEPPPETGFLIQDDGFFILQLDGSLIEITT